MRFLNSIFFGRAAEIVRAAKKKIIQEEDMIPLQTEIDPRAPSALVDKTWETPRELLRDHFRHSPRRLTKAYIFYALYFAMAMVQPLLINHFVKNVSLNLQDAAVFGTAIGLALALGFSSILRGVLVQHYFYGTLVAYVRMVNLVNEKLFRHSLVMSQRARLRVQVGDVVNHMSSDAETIGDFGIVFADMVYTILLVIGVAGMLFYFIGLSAVVPLIMLAMLAPVTRWIAKKFTAMDEELMKERDRRVTLMGQVLNAIRVIKYFCWEKSISEEVTVIRERELAARKKMAKGAAYSGIAYVMVSSIVLFTALLIHVKRGFALDPATVFTCISLFGLLEEPFGSLSWLLSRWTNAFVSAGRVVEFLKCETLPARAFAAESGEAAVGLRAPKLSLFGSVDMEITPGQSVAIVGPVGGGKSMLLSSLMGEQFEDRERLQYFDSHGPAVAARSGFVPQEAYIVNGSLRENLEFGSAVSESDLREALFASGLDIDVSQLPAGLATEIGEKGVNLSGGQKQRVNLARAILARPQILFLDDPLSAVDVETEKKTCERLIFGLWRDRTRLMATHRLDSLSRFDRILFVENGAIVADGNYASLMTSSERFRAFMEEHEKSEHALSVAEGVETKHAETSAEHRITVDEERETGAVKSSVYMDYFLSLGGEGRFQKLNLFFLIAGAVSVMGLPLLQRWWLGFVSSAQQGQAPSSGLGAWLYAQDLRAWIETPLSSVYVYGVIGVGALVLHLANNLQWLERGIQAGRLMQEKMLRSLMRAQIRFFDSTPVGRILQRFSRDVESVDIHLQGAFDSMIHILIEIFLCLTLIVVMVPVSALFIAPILFIYYWMQNEYRRPAREAKRLDSIARSPRYAHFKETLVGLSVIRGMNRESWFVGNFYDKLAHSQRMFYSHFMLNRWFSSRVPVVGGGIAVATLVAVVFSCRAGYINSGTAGLLSIYMLSFWGHLNWGIRVFSDIESRMTSVERLRVYSNLPAEREVVHARGTELPAEWPARGEITFENVSVRYAPHLPLVLKDVSFTIRSGQRVGLIGRTGSGKSTLFQTLYRFVEAEGGRILIDGEDIASIPLPRLRKSIAIIPQDPTLFMGTIRGNLDRYHEYTDAQVMEALDHAALGDFVRAQKEGLLMPVAENGLNLSQGQRQLLCLARALMTQAKVVVFDEATASVDVETDQHIQGVIQQALKGRTLLIIAHRLGTVATCDKVVELAAGRVLRETSRPGSLDKSLFNV